MPPTRRCFVSAPTSPISSRMPSV
ncbi:hypothetical protein BN1723_020083 [Verticillium longisporum]|uniref:Uncharacterized protein n=1 Tax=Verticillium longisporum TaxID=100787 RepID=A0A0G4NJN0_VERLO|nr:hypothetical protein BN1723_020083 [Verticillium longisporum]